MGGDEHGHDGDGEDGDENVRLRRSSRRSSSRTRTGISRTTGSSSSSGTKIKPLFLLVTMVSLAWSLYQLPLNRVIERRLCGEYYRGRGGGESDGEIAEEMCKVDEVQRGLGRIQGVMETGWVVGGMFLSLSLCRGSWGGLLC